MVVRVRHASTARAYARERYQVRSSLAPQDGRCMLRALYCLWWLMCKPLQYPAFTYRGCVDKSMSTLA
jgi:hypothetical protein